MSPLLSMAKYAGLVVHLPPRRPLPSSSKLLGLPTRMSGMCPQLPSLSSYQYLSCPIRLLAFLFSIFYTSNLDDPYWDITFFSCSLPTTLLNCTSCAYPVSDILFPFYLFHLNFFILPLFSSLQYVRLPYVSLVDIVCYISTVPISQHHCN